MFVWRLTLLPYSLLHRRLSGLQADASRQVASPMPGLVKSVAVSPGDMVSDGQEVCVIEAMKMQNSLVAAVAGKVKAVHVKEGDTVDDEQVLVELE